SPSSITAFRVKPPGLLNIDAPEAAPVAWDGAADGVLGTDASAVRRDVRRERREGLRTVEPRRAHPQQSAGRPPGREDRLARRLRDVQRPRVAPLRSIERVGVSLP